eukprot:TRINITY_DN4112_c0_g1_i3.p1 TRINITY_DN4112_c0_g1~~TRINITY_DN4112_c0_g1_i3.p1  ORF type:complete len:111 (-),score=6.39 TRINITY_DN4112_c0_g1_i3:120-452(-)
MKSVKSQMKFATKYASYKSHILSSHSTMRPLRVKAQFQLLGLRSKRHPNHPSESESAQSSSYVFPCSARRPPLPLLLFHSSFFASRIKILANSECMGLAPLLKNVHGSGS